MHGVFPEHTGDAPDLLVNWGGEGACKQDGGMLCHFLAGVNGLHGRTLIKELEYRGYDLETMRFTVRKKR